MDTRVGLVLEGGGMRGAYTAGVLDAFLDQGVDFQYVIGVSAGANAGADYVVEQRERNHKMFVELAAEPRYMGWSNLLRERSWFGMRYLFETAPDEVAPFDYEALRATSRTLVVAATDCATGQPAYFCHRDYDPRYFIHTVHRASCSLPLLSPPVSLGGRLYVDGGVSAPIPVERAFSDGNARNVVVLTRNAGHRKDNPLLNLLVRLALARYPAVGRTMRQRNRRYNACLARLAELERDGRVYIIRPVAPLVVGRMERDVRRLESLYRQGYSEASEHMPELRKWMTRDA